MSNCVFCNFEISFSKCLAINEFTVIIINNTQIHYYCMDAHIFT